MSLLASGLVIEFKINPSILKRKLILIYYRPASNCTGLLPIGPVATPAISRNLKCLRFEGSLEILVKCLKSHGRCHHAPGVHLPPPPHHQAPGTSWHEPLLRLAQTRPSPIFEPPMIAPYRCLLPGLHSTPSTPTPYLHSHAVVQLK
eukprot:758743-Hanusia_phi.AAC.2